MSRPGKPLTFIPPLLPDQTLYSWVTMFHELSGNISPDETRLQLFGSEKAGRHFHIPSHLALFCARTQLVLGGAEEIVEVATVLPFFTRFRARTVVADALNMARGDNAAGLSQMLNMGKTGHFWPLPRKSCPDCVREDRRKLNFAYWRRAHQLPGVLVCQEHGTHLHIFQMDENKRPRPQFMRPELEKNATGLNQAWRINSQQEPALQRLAIFAKDIADAKFGGAQDRDMLRNTCDRQLATRFKRSSASSHYDPLELSGDFERYFKTLRDIPEIGTILHQCGIKALWSLLEHSESHAHPLEWLLIVDWLFGDWQTFQHCFGENHR